MTWRTTRAQPDLRALEAMHEVPRSCSIFRISDNRSAPHLLSGEIAVVDETDTRPQIGELYLIKWNTGRRCVVQICRAQFGTFADGTEPLWVGAMNAEAMQQGIPRELQPPEPLRYLDGPYTSDHLESKLVGRIIGVLEQGED